MPFSFVNPWLLFGFVAVAAPLWLHLRRKKEINLVRFSAVRFLEDLPEPRKSPMRLQDWLLLALRLLSLLLLVTAFAWPYLRGTSTAPVRESRVYILDNTLSRQVNEGFIHDRDRVAEEIAQLGPDFQLAVIELRSNPHVVASFGDSRETAEQRVRELQPTYERGSYLAAFRQADALLRNSLGDQKRIILLGDNQENQWNENVNTPPFLRNVQVDLPKSQRISLPNLSLSEPRIQRLFLGDRSLVHFTAKLTHLGEARNAGVVLRANGQTVLSRDIDLAGKPESMVLQAQWEADPSAWIRGDMSVQGTPDVLAGDNRVFFSLPAVVEGRVALLAQSSYLRLALSPEIMRGEWKAHLVEPANLSAELASNEDADVLCLESSYLQSSEARKLLWRYLTNGRGAVLFVNRVTPSVKQCLHGLGFDLEEIVSTPKGQSERFQFVFSNHPVFHPFASPDYGNLMDIRVSKYARIKANQAMPLVFLESGAGLFFESAKFPGKLFVAAFGADRECSTWPVHQTFIPFLDLTLQAARAEDAAPLSYEPGETGIIQVPASVTAHEVILRDESREWARAPIELGRAQLKMPEQPGIYSMSYDNTDQVEKYFSVNPSPKESQLTYVESPDVLKLWSVNAPGKALTPSKASAPARFRLDAVLQQRWWWWMVLAGMCVLMLETAVVSLRKEHS
jgi:hypothetical protein